MLPIDTSVEAEYTDGYILSETEHNDVSPYAPPLNILDDILEKRPDTEHGKMVRFSLFYKDARYDVDWSTLPENARPIRFRNISGDLDPSTMQTVNHRTNWVKFGYQYTENGKSIKEIRKL